MVKLIAFVALSFDEIVTWPPAIFTSLVAAALMFTPPADDVNAIALSLVPAVFNILIV